MTPPTNTHTHTRKLRHLQTYKHIHSPDRPPPAGLGSQAPDLGLTEVGYAMLSPLQTPRTSASALRERSRSILVLRVSLPRSKCGPPAVHIAEPAWCFCVVEATSRASSQMRSVERARDAAWSTYVVMPARAVRSRGNRPSWLGWLMDECMWSWWVWGHTRARTFFHRTEEEGLSVYRETHLSAT